MTNSSTSLDLQAIQDIESARILLQKLADQCAEKDRLISDRDRKIVEHERSLHFKNTKIEALLFELSRMKRWRYAGSQTEALDSAQLKLFEESLETDILELETKLEQLLSDSKKSRNRPKEQPKRQAFPAHLERVDHHYEAEPCACGNCIGNGLKKIGEEISEQLDCDPVRFFVHRHIRPKCVCTACETITTAPMPAQIIDKGQPAPGLLAHVLISKYAYHLPLYRQEKDYEERSGVVIPRNTMSGWIGACGAALEPLYERLCELAVQQDVLHADETTVKVLVPGNKKTHRAYMWVYRTGICSPIQAVVFDFQMSRAGKHSQAFLKDFHGGLMIDDYSGYKALFKDSRKIELACLAHIRRKFFELHEANKSQIAGEALLLIGKLYTIEEEAKDWEPDKRKVHRQTYAKPILEAFETWLKDRRRGVPGGSGIAKAIAYAQGRWAAVMRYLEDGRYPIDNNPCENAIRPFALGRKNWMFIGTEGAGRRTAVIMSLIESAKANGLNPYLYLKDILTRLPTHPYSRLEELLPYQWKPFTSL